MMTRSNCRLQVAILSLALHMLLLPGYSRADFKVNVTGLNDPSAIHRVQFENLRVVMSVTSPFPSLIRGDPIIRRAITFDIELPRRCPIPVTITAIDKTGNGVTYTGTLTLINFFDPTALPNAAGIKGDKAKLDALIADLSETHEVQVVNREDTPPPQGNEEMAIVLVDHISGSNHLPKWKTEDMIEDAIIETPEYKYLAYVMGDCGPSCPEICNAILKPDGVVVTATVESQDDTVVAYLPSKWESICTREPLGVCTASPKHTCFNGGSCAAKGGSSPNICTCTPQTNLYGPRCQLLTRSYEGSDVFDFASHHSLSQSGNVPIAQPQTLTFSFEHAGKCQLDTGLCPIVIVKASGREIIKVEEGVVTHHYYDTATLPSDESLEEKNMTLYSDRMFQNERWIEVSVHVEMQGNNLQATTVFCTKEASPVCVEKKMAKAGVLYKMRDVELTLGRHVRGCFRNVRFNGGLVDLKLPGSVIGSYEGCSQQSISCSNKCGDGDANSNCYGVLGPFQSVLCSCKCASSKRMPAETVTLPSQCSAQCTTETPIINIDGPGTLDWTGTSGAPIPLDPEAPLTISFQMRTIEPVANGLLKVVGGSTTISIRLADTYLSACVAGSCYSFSSVPVSDGNWHEIFAMIAETQLTVRVGDYTRMYIIANSQPVSGATVSMQLTNGCIRDVRLSGVYMPASVAEKTVEKNSSDSVELVFVGTISSGSECNSV